MFKTKLFLETFLSLFIVFAINQLAIEYNLYWSINEFDSLVHFLGGVFASFFVIWLYFYSNIFAPKKRTFISFLKISFFGTIFISVVWEIYEIMIGEVMFSGKNYPFDTTLDFVMDMLGGLFACFYSYFREIHNFNSKINNKEMIKQND